MNMCKSIDEQIAACPCGNSRQNPDPYLGADGCYHIDCETMCPATVTLIDPPPWTSSVATSMPLAFDITRATGIGPGDASLIKVTDPAGMSVAGSATFQPKPTDPDYFVFTPAPPLQPDTIYRAGTMRSYGPSIPIGIFSTERRPMVAGLYWVAESAKRAIHLNLKFSEPVDPATVEANVSLTIDGVAHPLSITQKDARNFRADITDAATLPESGARTVLVRFAPAIATPDGRLLEPNAFGLESRQPDGYCLLGFGGMISMQRDIGYCVEGLSCDPADST